MLRQPEMRYVSARTREAWRRRAGRGWGTPEEVELYLGLRQRILRTLSDAGAGMEALAAKHAG